MRDIFIDRKKKDLLQITLIVILLFFYAFYETQRKNGINSYESTESAIPVSILLPSETTSPHLHDTLTTNTIP